MRISSGVRPRSSTGELQASAVPPGGGTTTVRVSVSITWLSVSRMVSSTFRRPGRTMNVGPRPSARPSNWNTSDSLVAETGALAGLAPPEPRLARVPHATLTDVPASATRVMPVQTSSTCRAVDGVSAARARATPLGGVGRCSRLRFRHRLGAGRPIAAPGAHVEA